MLAEIQGIETEQTPAQLKVVLPVKRKWGWFSLFSVLVLIWVVGLVWGIKYTIWDIALSGERFAFWFTLMLVVWLYIWYRLGKIVWKQWQYYAARREILFFDQTRLIIRRPLSFLGITDAFDLEYVTPFYYNAAQHSLAFAYGSQRIDFGYDLEPDLAHKLALALNAIYFPPLDDEDEDY